MRYLEQRYQNFLRCKNVFGKAQCRVFLSCLKSRYDKILEVGCGQGFFTYLMLKEKKIKFNHIYGVDVFEFCQKEELEELTNHFSFYKISENGHLPFPNNHFDLIFSMDVIEHVFNDRKFISEQIRVSKPGGEILIGTPNRYRIANLPLLITGKLKYPKKIGNDYYGEVIHVREYNREEIFNILSLFKREINRIKVIPCWLGFDLFDIGWTIPKGYLSYFCQFWFIRFSKKEKLKT